MPKSMTVRNIDDAVFVKLRQRAARHGRSTEAEVREILAEVAASEPAGDFWERAAQLRAEIGNRPQTPSEVLQREGRDER